MLNRVSPTRNLLIRFFSKSPSSNSPVTKHYDVLLVKEYVWTEQGSPPPASPSIYVISDVMTAVFKNPLSATRKPLSVSFSSRSPGLRGAAICLKAVAGTVLFVILQAVIPSSQFLCSSRKYGSKICTHGILYTLPVRLSRTVSESSEG